MKEPLVLVAWLAVATALALAWWARRSARSGKRSWLSSASAVLVALPNLAAGALLVLISSQQMVRDDPELDMQRRLVFMATGSGTLLAAASLLQSAWRLLPRKLKKRSE